MPTLGLIGTSTQYTCIPIKARHDLKLLWTEYPCTQCSGLVQRGPHQVLSPVSRLILTKAPNLGSIHMRPFQMSTVVTDYTGHQQTTQLLNIYN